MNSVMTPHSAGREELACGFEHALTFTGAGMSKFAADMPDGQTVASHIKPSIAAAYESGTMTPLSRHQGGYHERAA
ncbi:hypothetical protein [Nitrobacter sp. JJSN]|uniref:hypothetical protein n=1 Tax=Nitrobacter sp. JJSN TaxID=3453033 RepID=UPI003F7606D2